MRIQVTAWVDTADLELSREAGAKHLATGDLWDEIRERAGRCDPRAQWLVDRVAEEADRAARRERMGLT